MKIKDSYSFHKQFTYALNLNVAIQVCAFSTVVLMDMTG